MTRSTNRSVGRHPAVTRRSMHDPGTPLEPTPATPRPRSTSPTDGASPPVDSPVRGRAHAFLTDMVAAGTVVDAVSPAAHLGTASQPSARLVPVVTYPDEWTFGMLRDAALLVLRVFRSGLARGVMCTADDARDVQFMGTHPLLFGAGAFRPRRRRDTWSGAGAFHRTFLNPLLLTARYGVPFQPLLRLHPGGIGTTALERLALQRSGGSERSAGRRGPYSRSGRIKPLSRLGDPIDREAADLERLISSLDVPGAQRGEPRPRTYREPVRVIERRDHFILDALAHARPQTVLDLADVDGRYARAVADTGARVVAAHRNERRADQIYESLHHYLGLTNAARSSIFSLVADVTGPRLSEDASPGRVPFADRIRPSLVLASEPLRPDADLDAPTTHDISGVLRLLRQFTAATVVQVPTRCADVLARHLPTRYEIARREELTPTHSLLELMPTPAAV